MYSCTLCARTSLPRCLAQSTASAGLLAPAHARPRPDRDRESAPHPGFRGPWSAQGGPCVFATTSKKAIASTEPSLQQSCFFVHSIRYIAISRLEQSPKSLATAVVKPPNPPRHMRWWAAGWNVEKRAMARRPRNLVRLLGAPGGWRLTRSTDATRLVPPLTAASPQHLIHWAAVQSCCLLGKRGQRGIRLREGGRHPKAQQSRK